MKIEEIACYSMMLDMYQLSSKLRFQQFLYLLVTSHVSVASFKHFSFKKDLTLDANVYILVMDKLVSRAQGAIL